MDASDEAVLRLWPAGYHPEGIALDVDQATLALDRYHTVAEQGPDYFAAAALHQGQPQDNVEFGHLAWAVLLAGQPTRWAAQALLSAAPIDISQLSATVALEELPADSRTLGLIAETIWKLCELDWFGVAVATKVLHPLRPRLVPVIDRQSFFGTYFFDRWRLPQPAAKRHPRHLDDVEHAVLAVHRVVSADENERAWTVLQDWNDHLGRGPFTRIQLFDMLWWSLWKLPEQVILRTH